VTSSVLRVILELGKKRRVVAGAMDWPGLDRWATSEEDAIARLVTYRQRYRRVAAHAGLEHAFDALTEVVVVERVPGSSSTDFWGIAHVPSDVERSVVAPDELERRLTLLRACWAVLDEITASAPAELLPGPRSAGRTRDEIIRHVVVNEPGQFTRKVEVRTSRETVLTAAGLAAHREATLAAIRAYNAEGKAARTWPIQFLVRRIAHHVMDHAWEIEDRTPAG
jgi:hypothetical protein